MYNNFSYVYDYFMDNIPYDEWVENILEIFHNNHFTPRSILDLGCGTGELTSKLQTLGFNMSGIDLSKDMINVAKQKSIDNKQDIQYTVQNMVDFTLNNNVDAMISTCDSYNYILDDNDLLKSFKRVYKYLNDNGMFIFDMNTEHYFKETLGECMYSDVALDSAYIVENKYSQIEKINTYELNLFVENKNGSYDRNIEIHKEKARSIDEVCNLLNRSNFQCLHILDTETLDCATSTSDRIYFVCVKGD